MRAQLELMACPDKYLDNDGLVTAFGIYLGTKQNPKFYGFTGTEVQMVSLQKFALEFQHFMAFSCPSHSNESVQGGSEVIWMARIYYGGRVESEGTFDR